MTIAAGGEGDGIFQPSFVHLFMRTTAAVNTGAMFSVFALAVNDSLLKGSAIFLMVTYLSMFNYWRRLLAPVGMALFLFAMAKWLDIDFVAVLSKLK
ncbi:hypothetical protein GA0061098_1009130 [Bradyrhizobium shewense]|uniref:Uncharacterized protein n=1 Tax=Bradyrhizobium shewense TaxID=1761772 RepID=A0A1C3WR65_9BRAD|nr:hypothetical protein [Bradyrhizobium shewense]SCB42517.1 hypothetical protein GA0061098_1009130 [Bradyrhizobium shewense]